MLAPGKKKRDSEAKTHPRRRRRRHQSINQVSITRRASSSVKTNSNDPHPTPNPNMYQEQFVSHLVVSLCPSAVAIRVATSEFISPKPANVTRIYYPCENNCATTETVKKKRKLELPAAEYIKKTARVECKPVFRRNEPRARVYSEASGRDEIRSTQPPLFFSNNQRLFSFLSL